MIRDLERDDIQACIEIVNMNWGDEVAARFADEVGHAFNISMKWPPQYFVYDVGGKVVGFGGMKSSWIMHEVWDLIWVNVHPDYRCNGSGMLLTSFRISEVKRKGGAVINLMTKIPDFFAKFDFQPLHEYDGGWCLMTLQLKPLKL